MAAIAARATIPFDRFIFALGIRQVGQATARLLAKQYGNLVAWRDAMDDAQDDIKIVDAHHHRVAHQRGNIHRAGHLDGADAVARVGIDAVLAVAAVDGRAEHHHGLPRILCASNTADQLFGLAAVHTAGDDLDPANITGRKMRLHAAPITSRSCLFSPADTR